MTFSKVYDGTEPEVMYQDAPKMIVSSFLEGKNGCIMCYGVTSSGKTFCIERILSSTISHVLNDVQKIDVSYLEIYNEYVYDLIDKWNKTPTHKTNPHKMENKIENVGSILRGITEAEIKSSEEITELISYGKQKRTTEATLANANSSRVTA